MRILSAKLPMTDSFSEKDYYAVIVKWLKNAGPCAPIGKAFEECSKKRDIHLEEGYCSVDTKLAKQEKKLLHLFKLTHTFHEQTWITEVIFQENGFEKEVYFHIFCSRDTTHFDEVPDIRTDVIRVFIHSGFVCQPEMPITDEPITVCDNNSHLLATAVQKAYKGDMPIVLATQFFDSMAFAIDEYKVAKSLAGVARVYTADSEYTRIIESKATKKAPYNGSVAIYNPNSNTPRVFRPEDAFHGTNVEKLVLDEVVRSATAAVDADAPTWNAIIEKEAAEKSAMLDVALGENGSLEEQLRLAKKKIADLSKENYDLKTRNEVLELALERETTEGLIIPAPEKEFYSGEQHDLLITVIKKALQNYPEDTRAYELLSQILKVNTEIGNGKIVFETLKSVLKDGQKVSERDIKALEAVGFECVSEANHYKFKFHGSDKYWFPLAKTPSDDRGGKNTISDITKRLSVYK